MIFLLIGLVIGLIMGITGAGGAIISIPLFQVALGSTLKEATVLSLVAVIFGTGSNVVARLREVNWQIVGVFTLTGALSGYLALPYKKLLPELVITILLILIGLYSLLSVWKDQNRGGNMKSPSILLLVPVGLLLGLITTFTGLGGGVLLIPILIGIFGMTYEKAVPTSLASILFITLSSLLSQLDVARELISGKEILFIAAGAASAYAVLTLLLRKLSEAQTLKLRRVVFGLVTMASLTFIVMKTL